ncbi:unnamed protein product [Blepharisma stoltei]|uniref:LisH domain-containing protein n=1 Tax=Blepharisma stoltei TaxID=1481888 RepID=A0AAU9JY36_9CILI|nr:unnamed protein product [Blepharisma stoltei]
MEELQNSIYQELEQTGVLDYIRAALRAKIFQAVDMHESKAGFKRPETKKILETEIGQICSELARNFLECFKIKHTLDIFLQESQIPAGNESVQQLERIFGVKSAPNRPILLAIVEGLFPPGDEEIEGTTEDSEEEEEEPELPNVSNKNQQKPPGHMSPRSQRMYQDHHLESGSSIEENIESRESIEDYKHDELVESGGTSSLGYDQSVNSLALEEFDYIEPIKKPKR